MFISTYYLSFLLLFSFFAILACFWTLRTTIHEERERLYKKIKKIREEYNTFLDDYSLMKEENRTFNRSTTEMENLYKITRKMSEALEFDDIFKTFNEFLFRGMRFKECKLLLVGKDDDNLYIEKTYKMKHTAVSGEEGVQLAEPELKDEIALALFHEDQRASFLSMEKDNNRLRQFYPKQDIVTLVSNPLIVEDELIGILVIEDLAEKDVDKFLILAGQFALEIKKVRLYETIQKLAIIDGLTSVYMRRHFLERVEEELKRSEYHKLNMSFLLIDIDHFKVCNDRYGHLVGDAVLKELAHILKRNVREIDIICRYGGEEFLIALPDTAKKGALMVAERIRVTVEEAAFHAYEESPQVTVSTGVSSYPQNGKRIEELIEAADKALYKAKHTGRNKVCVA